MTALKLAVVAIGCAAWVVLALPEVAGARSRRPDPNIQTVFLPAGEALEKGLGSTSVQHDFASGGVSLYDTMLVEDDSPGAGGNTPWTAPEENSPMVSVDAGTQIKKVLLVDRPESLEAVLYVRPGRATLVFNGKVVEAKGSDKFFKVPPELVKKGENEVIVRAQGDANACIKLALRKHILENNPELKDRPARSYKSTDGGRSWQPVDGEFTIRLNLTQYLAQGEFTSPVLDLAKTERDALGLAKITVRSLSVKTDAQTPPGTSVEVALRFGTSAVYDKAQWTDWMPPSGDLPKDRRYVQWKATLKTDSAKVTPLLKSVRLDASVAREARPAWAAKLFLKGYHNERIYYTSMPFEYEDPAHPRMKALREKYKLDEIVKDARSELEKIVLLRDWVSRQWRFKGPEGHYPAWDADEILTRQTGMCVQYAIAHIQCCIAMGFPARYVCGYHEGTMGTAHEVAEVWSNEYSKWVFMDPTTSRNEFAADPRTGEPLSMLEVHDRMVKHYYGDKPAAWDARPAAWGRWSDGLALVRGPTVTINQALEGSDPLPKDWPSWTKWLQLHYVPRNNWYAKPHPLPRLQGWNLFDWTDFWTRYDAQTSRDRRYGRYASRRSDTEWTINQVHFGAAYGEKAGTIQVHMGTVTPNFQTFLVNVDGKGWKESPAALTWEIHTGVNRLEMRVRNTSGVLGPVSFIEFDNPTP